MEETPPDCGVTANSLNDYLATEQFDRITLECGFAQNVCHAHQCAEA
jgi:hypothetical protein